MGDPEQPGQIGARGESKVPPLVGATRCVCVGVPATAKGSLGAGDIAQLIERLFSMHETLVPHTIRHGGTYP